MSGQLILGKDIANDKYVPISVDSTGHLDIDVQVADLVMRANDGNDGAGTDRTVKCDSNGELFTQTTLAAGHGLATEAKQDTINSTLGDTNSKIDAMRGTSDLGVINTSLGTVNSTLGDTNSKIDAMRGSSDLGAINTNLTNIEAHQGNIENNLSSIQSTVSSNKLQVDVISSALPSGAATQSTLADIEAHQGNIENNLSSIQSTVSSNKLQVDVITNSDSTKATSTNQSTMITALNSLAGCVSGSELQVDIVSGGGGGGGGGDASAANQTTMINHLSEIEGAVETIEGCVGGTELQCDIVSSALPSGAATAVNQTTANTSLSNIDGKVATQTTLASIDGKVATETTLAAAEVHLGNIDTQTSSIQSNVSTSANQSTMITHLSEIEGAVETVEACVASNRLAVDTNNATHGTLATLAVGNGNTGEVSAILDTAGYSKLVLIAKNSTNTTTSIMASLLWSDNATFTGGTDLVMNSEDLSGGAFAPVSFQSATSADSSTFIGAQAMFTLTPPAQYVRVNCFQGTGISINVDFFYILAR